MLQIYYIVYQEYSRYHSYLEFHNLICYGIKILSNFKRVPENCARAINETFLLHGITSNIFLYVLWKTENNLCKKACPYHKTNVAGTSSISVYPQYYTRTYPIFCVFRTFQKLIGVKLRSTQQEDVPRKSCELRAAEPCCHGACEERAVHSFHFLIAYKSSLSQRRSCFFVLFIRRRRTVLGQCPFFGPSPPAPVVQLVQSQRIHT